MSIIKYFYHFHVINFTFLEANDNRKRQPQLPEHGIFCLISQSETLLHRRHVRIVYITCGGIFPHQPIQIHEEECQIWLKLLFSGPFNNQGYIGTGPQHYHLWEQNPNRGESAIVVFSC